MSKLKVLDLFSCVGCHALGMHRAGHETVAFCEVNAARRAVLASQFPGALIHHDIRDLIGVDGAQVAFGGPPCQATSVAAAIHGKRDGESLWREMFRVGICSGVEWFVVEQPPGNAAWEAQVCRDLSRAGYHTARFEFAASDVRAPYPRRRVYILACTSLPRLEVAWAAGPSAIERVARAADARADWDSYQLAALRVDAWSAGEMDRSRSRGRRERIEALGDSNPPAMAEVIGHMLAAGA